MGDDAVSEGAVTEVDVSHPLGGRALGPVNSTLVVVVQSSGGGRVREVHVVAAVSEREDLLDGLVGGADLGFAGGTAGALLADGLPSDGAAAAHDEVAADRAVLEHLHLFSILDGIPNLAAPIGVTETLHA